jgi:hypothetical protein
MRCVGGEGRGADRVEFTDMVEMTDSVEGDRGP